MLIPVNVSGKNATLTVAPLNTSFRVNVLVEENVCEREGGRERIIKGEREGENN